MASIFLYSCPSFQFEEHFQNCTVTEESCKALKTALFDCYVIPASGLELFVDEILSEFLYQRRGVNLSHENSFDMNVLMRGKKLSHNSSLVYPRSLCDSDLYLSSMTWS